MDRETLVVYISRMLERATEQQLRIVYQFILYLAK